jgi:hypothetical protein
MPPTRLDRPNRTAEWHLSGTLTARGLIITNDVGIVLSILDFCGPQSVRNGTLTIYMPALFWASDFECHRTPDVNGNITRISLANDNEI